MLTADPGLLAARPAQTLIGDKNYYGRDFEATDQPGPDLLQVDHVRADRPVRQPGSRPGEHESRLARRSRTPPTRLDLPRYARPAGPAPRSALTPAPAFTRVAVSTVETIDLQESWNLVTRRTRTARTGKTLVLGLCGLPGPKETQRLFFFYTIAPGAEGRGIAGSRGAPLYGEAVPTGATSGPSPCLARRRRRRVGKNVPVGRHPVCPGVGLHAAGGRSGGGAGAGGGWAGHLPWSLLVPWPGARPGTSVAAITPGCAGVSSLVLPLSLACAAASRWPRLPSPGVVTAGRPLDDQARAARGWGGILLSPYGKRTGKTRCHCCSPSLRARVTVRWSTRSPGVGLGWLFAIWSGTPPRNPPGGPGC